MKYYNIKNLLKKYPKAQYYLVIGERSNGKTYSALEYALDKFINDEEQFAYVRRWGEDIRKAQMVELFSAMEHNDVIKKKTGGVFTSVNYTAKKFYLANTDEEGDTQILEKPIGYAFDLNSMEHYKSISFPGVTTIIFDEFLSRQGYLPNEFILFSNTLSTIIRNRDNIKIIMLGNTVNKYCPYFGEMGLTHVPEQTQGTIDEYRYSNEKLTVVVEYCESGTKRGGKKSDVYFAFDNPQLQMITSGSWEIAIYPHLTQKYRPKDIVFIFFIEFQGVLLQCEIVATDDTHFMFVHRKTTEIQSTERDIIYTTSPNERWNYRVGIYGQKDKLSKTIIRLIDENRVFYSTNEMGEILRNYLQWSESYSVTGD